MSRLYASVGRAVFKSIVKTSKHIIAKGCKDCAVSIGYISNDWTTQNQNTKCVSTGSENKGPIEELTGVLKQ